MKRRFRGLREQSPREHYDVVVIGAGIAGLVSANLLATESLSVLLVEQHYMTGGYCSTFRRGGYTFDASTHFYPLLGNPDTAPGRLLARLGVETEWLRMDPVDTFHCPDGSHFEVAADFDVYRADLDREFPDHRQALAEFFDLVQDAYRYGLLAYFRGRLTDRFRELEPLSVRDVLDSHFPGDAAASRKLKLVLTGDCPHWGSPPSRTSFVFDAMLRLSYFLGNYYPEGGSQAFADELARTFEERGGDILMSTTARRLEVQGGRVSAVEIETLRGPHADRRLVIPCGAVLANTDLDVVHRLLPADSVPESLRRAGRELRPSFPCFLTHLGLRGVSAETLDRVQGYYWNEWDTDLVGANGLRCKVFVPTVYDPSVAPEGGQVVILQKVLDLEALQATELGTLEDETLRDPSRWSADDWQRHKQAVESYIFGHLCDVVPGLERDGSGPVTVDVKLSATAATARRFTHNTAGAMLGWEMSPDQLGKNRPGLDGPVDGLTLTGHWVRPGGGIVPVLVSAEEAARRVLAGSRSADDESGPVLRPARLA